MGLRLRLRKPLQSGGASKPRIPVLMLALTLGLCSCSFFIADPLTPGDNATSHTDNTDGFSAGASERRSKSVEEDKGGRNLRPNFFATLCKITKSLFCSLASVKNLR